MKLSIILVNYKTRALLMDCLEGLYKHTGGCDFEVIVVDNDSGDSIGDLLRVRFPGSIFLQMGYNAGFARANNAAIRIAKGDAFLLLNSDTLIRDNAIGNTVNKLLASPCYVAAGVQLLNEDGSPQISGNYAMKGGLNYLLPLPYIGKFLRGIAFLLKVKKPNVPDASTLVEVDWINGAFLMVKKTAVDKAGLLDEDFFLYAEEAEWCSRIKKAGRLCIDGEEHVVHLQGSSANDAFESAGKGYFNLFDRKGLQIMLSNFVRIRKQFGLAWFFFDLLCYVITIPVFFLGVLIERIIRGKKATFSFKQLAGFSSNMVSLLKYTATIVANKPHFYKVL